MKRTYALTLIAVILTVGLFIGCDDSSSPGITDGGTSGGVADVELRFSQTLINGVDGENISMTITAVARDLYSNGVAGASMQFGIIAPEAFKGTIATSSGTDTTDQNGQISATYTVVLQESADVIIFAESGQVRTEKTLQLLVRNEVGVLSVQIERSILTVAPDETKPTMVTATLVDEIGTAIPGVEVAFSTRPATRGFVDAASATTDNSGRAIVNFRTIANEYGDCEVIANVGDSEAMEIVQIRQVSGPADIGAHAEPARMRPAEGQNATSVITAVVTDDAGVGVPDTYVLFELVGMNDGAGPIFGSLTNIDTSRTNPDGVITTTFNTRGGVGQQFAKVTVLPTREDPPPEDGSAGPTNGNITIKIGDKSFGMDEELSAIVLLTVDALEDEPASMDMTPSIDFMNLPPDSSGQSIIYVIVRDSDRNGIQGLTIDFSTDKGTLSQPTATDTNGVASATFTILPRVDLPDIDEATDVTITAEIPGTGWSASTTITILPTSSDVGSLSIETDRRFIWADGPGLSMAEITVILKDADGQSLSGREIIFTSNFANSVIQSPVLTDSSGRATSFFDDNRVPSFNEDTGLPDSVVITAKFTPDGLNSFLKVMIREQNPVDRIDLFASARQLTANSGDSSAVRATCFLVDGSPAPAGTRVIFDTNNGSFTDPVAFVAGNAGQAFSYYLAGVIVGTAQLKAMYQELQDTVISNMIEIDLISGPPSFVTVSPSPQELITSDPASVSIVTATVTDTSGNPVRQGTYVTFASSLGTITPSSITDEFGDATSLLRPGVESGIAEVTVTCQGIVGIATVTFIAGTPNSIALDADPLNIQVRGGGGITTSTLRATVRDPNGNLIETPTTVVFELINEPEPPQGCTIGADGQIFMSRTSNGIAVATLNAGTQIGGKLIKAYTWRDSLNNPDDIVEVISSRVSVTSGPPFELDIDVNNEGEDGGGGAWIIEVSARVWDEFRNPVANLIPVVFSISLQNANIEAGFTGNVGRNGDSVDGLAFSDLVYNSVNTFEELEITAVVQTEFGEITGSRPHILPLQEGVMELNVDPANWMFEDGRADAVIRCWVVLNDGHGIEINNGPILFTANRAVFGWLDLDAQMHLYYPEAVRKLTGIRDELNDEQPGQATVFLVAEEPDIFLDPFTLEVTVQVNATVEGYDDVSADPDFIFFTRHAN